ncbi:glycosyltransferase, partial [bacterium]|nr:glycosyltransferase [bacterium]
FMWPTRSIRRWVEGQIADFAPDVVVFGAPHPLAHMGPGLRERTGVPYAVMCHGAEITIPAAVPLLRRLVRWPLRRADSLFAVSRFTARRVERLTRRPVSVIGAGVDIEAFTPADAPPDSPVIACVSRFVPRKGHDRVLRSVARLREQGVDATALIVGTGRLEKRLRRLADDLGVPTRFEVGVPWSELGGLYRTATVFVMPCRSRWFGLEVEGLGIVFLEAAAAGLPVLAGDSGGAPETVIPGRTGFVVPDDDAIDQALRMLVAAPDWARRVGAAGRRRVEAEFTWNAAAGRMIHGLEAILSESDGDDPS